MKKKILSILTSLCLILATVQPIADILASGGVWGGGSSVPSLSDGFYQISSGEELAWFSQQVNSGSSTIKGKLTADIIMNNDYSTDNNFTPIGTQENPFKGEFDGGGFKITNLYIETSSDNVGLFGYVEGTRPEVDDNDDSTEEVFKADPLKMIYNIHLEKATIKGNQNVGGIVGYISYGIVSDCYFDGTLTAEANSAGGIAGYIFDYAIVQRSISKGTIQGVIRSGGICGYIKSNATVLKCYSTADVFSNANVNGNAGGIAGTVSAGVVNGCYFLGRVYGPKRVGGIVGTNSYSTILGCYTLSPVYTTIQNNTEYIAAIAGYSLGGTYYNCYYNETTSLWTDENATARTLDQMKKFSFARELNENGNAFTYDYMQINNGYPVLAWTLETSVWAGGKEEPQKDAAGYYLISTADELAWFSALVNGTLAGVDQNTSAKAKVVENILLNIFVIEDSEETNIWTPIGTSESPFEGIFIGNYYNIAGIYTNGTSYQGLFGNIGTNGTVSDIVMLDCLITGEEYVGGIAGNNKGTISYSANDSTVRGAKYIGGITGYNSGSVTSSYNVGTVECNSASGAHIGGIVGSNQRGKIQQCFNNGVVQGAAGNYFGGIAGSASGDGIYNSYNSGKINGGYYIGGIAGYITAATITNCYNRGNVNSQNSMGTHTGNFIGYVNGSCYLTNCYYDTSIENSVMVNSTNAVGCDTANLTGATIATDLGFQAGYWTSKASNSYFDYYPQITTLATANCEKMKADSLESAKIVQKQFMLHVKIDGKNDSYHENFENALTAIGTKKGYIIPIHNITLSETINIANNVTIYGLNFNRTITRDPAFTDVLFNVTGTLSLGDIKNGNDSDPLVTFEGNKTNVTASSPLIYVNSGATLNTYPGFSIKEAKSSTVGSVIYNNEGTVNINGGYITTNETTTDGGTIYNYMGTINMTAGTIDSSLCSGKGAAIYNHYGIMNISGGTFSNNYAKNYGGAIYTIGDGETVVTISETATFTTNSAKAGGAFFVNSGSFVMVGGTVSENFAYNTKGSTPTTGGGGAAIVSSDATFTMTGGVIDSNYVYTQTGSGYGLAIYGAMQMGGSAAITNNDVFLAKNKTVEILDGLTAAGTALTITPYSYAANYYVLSGVGMGLSYQKVEITPDGTSTEWNVNSSGYLMNSAIQNVASLSKLGAYSVEYVSLAEAVANVAADEEGIITIIADNTISETIKVYGDVTILSETDTSYTSRRSGSFTSGALFEVQSGGKLRLGYSNIEVQGTTDTDGSSSEENGEITTDSVGGEYHLDGGNNYYGATGTSSIKVLKGGTLYTYDDFYLEYGYSTEGTINVLGEMYMYGGTIRNNLSANGGAIYVPIGGSVHLYGGTITGNKLSGTGCGKAIYCAGSLTRAAHSYVYYQNDLAVAFQDTYTNITSDNDVYMTNGKKITLADVESKVLLSETSEIPETTHATATTMYISYPSYSVGMIVLIGTDIDLHYSSFAITTVGYYIKSDGKLGVNLLVPASSSSYVVTRGSLNYVSGIDTSLNLVGYVKNQFANTDKIEILDINGNILSSGDIVTTGCVVRLYDSQGTEIVDSIYIVIYGDVDCDGYIDGMDSMLVSCLVAGALTSSDLSAAQIEAGDIDNTSSVNLADAAYIQQCGAFNKTVQQY